MTAFDDMLDDLFADPNMASDAAYTPAGGELRTIRVIQSAPDVQLGEFVTKAKATPLRVDIRVSDAPELAAGDAIEIQSGDLAGSYVVSSCDREAQRNCWRAALKVAP